MSKLYDNLLVPEWRSAVSPKNFAHSVLQGLRAFTGRIAAMVGLSPRHAYNRAYHRTLVIPLSDIVYVSMPAATDVVAGPTIIAGEATQTMLVNYPDSCNKYRLYYNDPDIDFFGAGFSDYTAIRGRDFYFHDGAYWFNEHPSKYGTVGIAGKQRVLTLLCGGGTLAVTADPLGVAYRGSVNSAVRDAITRAVYDNSPLGITRNILHAVAGCSLSTRNIKAAWVEGDMLLGLDVDNKLNYAPKSSGVKLNVGAPPDLSQVLNTSTDFLLTLPDHSYVIPLGDNNIEDFPEVGFRFPGIVVNNSFKGAALFAQLIAEGCVFYQWSYIDNNQNKQQSLVTYNIGTGKAVTTTIATAGADVLGLQATDIQTSNTPTPVWLNTTTSCYNYI